MSVYTVRLGASNVVGRAAGLIFTARAGVRTVVRDVVVLAQPTADSTWQIYVSSPVASYQLVWGEAAAPVFTHLEMRQALEPGDQVYANIQSGTMNVGITGYEFTL